LFSEPEKVLFNLCQFLGVNFDKLAYNSDEKVGNAEITYNRFISKFLINTAHLIRGMGLHSIPNFGKKIGIKRMLAKKTKLSVKTSIKKDLEEVFKEDRNYLIASGINLGEK
jgi:hypothetical protein